MYIWGFVNASKTGVSFHEGPSTLSLAQPGLLLHDSQGQFPLKTGDLS